MPAKKGQKTGRKPNARAQAAEPVKKVAQPPFAPTPRNFRIGGDVRPRRRDLSRWVKWPAYVRIQRQRRILLQRLKIPPALMQFQQALDKNQAAELFRFLLKYQPETKQAKRERLRAMAASAEAGGNVEQTRPPPVLKFGLQHVTHLVENQKASLVVIPHDVNPIELVVWLPTLCRRMNVPFCIVKGKGRVGQLVHQKNAAVVALTQVNKEDEAKLRNFQNNFREQFNDNIPRRWGGGIMGLKTQRRLEQRQRAIEAELAKRAQL